LAIAAVHASSRPPAITNTASAFAVTTTLDSPVSFDIERSHRDPSGSEAKLRAVVRMRPGQKVVVARIERSDGSKTEVIATLK
jgi:hypothetical protein